MRRVSLNDVYAPLSFNSFWNTVFIKNINIIYFWHMTENFYFIIVRERERRNQVKFHMSHHT